MHLILAGGGNAQESRPLDEHLLTSMQGEKRLLYIPIAFIEAGPQACLAWFTETFNALSFTNFEMWDTLEDRTWEALDAFDGIYIGGGNTYYLLNEMRRTGFDTLLQKFAESDRPIYGGSAGAIIFGCDIDTAGLGVGADVNEVSLKDTRGLNLLNGVDIQCHYELNQESIMRAHVEATGRAMLALTERNGLVVRDDTMHIIGSDSAALIAPAGITLIQPNFSFSL